MSLLARMLDMFGDSSGADPYWANVTSLLHFDGASGATTVTDETGIAWSMDGGGGSLSTAQKVFGPTSYFVGAGSFLRTTGGAQAGHTFGNGEFTIETFYRPFASSLPGGQYRVLASRDNTASGGTREWIFLQDGDAGGRLGFSIRVGATGYFVQRTTPLAAGVWVHVAVTRKNDPVNGDKLRLFVGGVLEAEIAITGTANNSNQPTRVSGFWTSGGVAGQALQCYFDEFRITKGVARYTAAFTPPAAPFPNT